jgi:hypothetical protein
VGQGDPGGEHQARMTRTKVETFHKTRSANADRSMTAEGHERLTLPSAGKADSPQLPDIAGNGRNGRVGPTSSHRTPLSIGSNETRTAISLSATTITHDRNSLFYPLDFENLTTVTARRHAAKLPDRRPEPSATAMRSAMPQRNTDGRPAIFIHEPVWASACDLSKWNGG